MSEDRVRAVRAGVRNAMIWATGWALAGGMLASAMSLFSPALEIGSLPVRLGIAAFVGIGWGIRFGLAGAVIGALFSAVIRVRYRGSRVTDVDPIRFGLLGAVVGGVGVPLYAQAMNVLFGGGPIPWELVLDDAPWASVMGGVVAAGTILLARRADASSADELPGLLAARAKRERLPGRPWRESTIKGDPEPVRIPREPER